MTRTIFLRKAFSRFSVFLILFSQSPIALLGANVASAAVGPTLTSATITSDGSSIGNLDGATIKTRITGADHVLGISDVNVSNGPIIDGDYAFKMITPSNSADLKSYFAAKGWPENYVTQINSEIDGISPFFYFRVNGTTYTLVDGFKKSLLGIDANVTIDDDYPIGTYIFNGDINGSSVTVTLTVTKPDTTAPEINTINFDQKNKTITYVFSEPIHFVSQIDDLITQSPNGLIKIYTATSYATRNVGDLEPASFGGVTTANLDITTNTLTVSYSDDLPVDSYLSDTWNYTVMDLAGNKLIENPATAIFTVTPVFNGDVTGFVGAQGLTVSGYTTGDFITTIAGILTEYSNPGQRVSFQGTITGDIIGNISGGVNYNGYDTLFAEIKNSGALGHVYLIGEFEGSPGHFVGEFITQDTPINFVTEITILGSNSVMVGNTQQFTATVDKGDNEIAWSVYVEDQNKATIDQNGLLTAKAPGTVTVIASALDGSLVTKNYSVTITPDTVAPSVTSVVATSTGTIVYNFDEAVQLMNADKTAVIIPDGTKGYADSLGIYKFDEYVGRSYGEPETPTYGTITNAVLSNGNKTLTITYAGSLVNQTDTAYVVDARGLHITDAIGNKVAQSENQKFTIAGDNVAPSVTSVVATMPGTIVYNFDEAVELRNNDGTPASIDNDKLAIYVVTNNNYDQTTKALGVSITNAVLSNGDKTLNISYNGSLINQATTNYVVDARGYRITDALNNKMLPSTTNIFSIAGDNVAPTATVEHNERDKTITYNFDEPTELRNNDGSTVAITPDKFAIYEINGGDYGPDTQVNEVPIISAVRANDGLSIVLTYSGSLVENADTDYVVDARGYRITDVLNNKMLPDSDQIFTVRQDTTNPIINLNSGSPFELEIHHDYTEAAIASDDRDGLVDVITSGVVNKDVVGTYTITYNAVDHAGNQADEITRTINVVDSIDSTFNSISSALSIGGILNNLNTIYTDNITSFAGLYFEKTGLGKITFNKSLNLSDNGTQTFLQNLGTKLDMSNGFVSLDARTAEGLKNAGASIEMYNLPGGLDLNQLSLVVKDDDGDVLDDEVATSMNYKDLGACMVGGICTIFSFDASHFTSFDIAPIITIDPYSTEPTNLDITVTASTNEGTLNTSFHVFTVNGSFDFVATDDKGNQSTKTITITNIDKNGPSASVTQVGDTITYTFNEPVKLMNSDYTAEIAAAAYASKLAIYTISEAGDYSLSTKVDNVISSATLDSTKTILTIKYVGSLIKTTTTRYVVDARGYHITDMLNNKMPASMNNTFVVNGVPSTPTTIPVSSGGVDITIQTGTSMTIDGVLTSFTSFPIPTYSTSIPSEFSESRSTIQGVVDLNFLGNAQFSKPVKIEIPVVGVNSVYIKANHGEGFTLVGLTTDPNATCSAGAATPAYAGGAITVVGGMATIYTCSASTFAAYSVQSSGGGGGSSSAKDYCPNGDNSPSYYDGKCEPKEKKNDKIKVKVSSGEVENNLLTGETEEESAYKFAFGKGITSMKTLKEANMNGILTREQMAKMIVNYAINVLGKTINTGAVCKFSDTANQSDEMKGYITQACQLGIMGVNTKKFVPNGIVNRGQLGTVISRLLYSTAESGSDYYSVHLNALKDKGVITNTNPNLLEKRAFLMLMLMRSAQ